MGIRVRALRWISTPRASGIERDCRCHRCPDRTGHLELMAHDDRMVHAALTHMEIIGAVD